MANTVGDVAIGITADIGPLIRETDRAKAVMSNFQSAMNRTGSGFNKVGDAALRLSGILNVVDRIGGVIVRTLGSITTKAASMGDAIGDGAKAAGLSTTAFQEYRFAIKEAADMTDDEFASAMVKLNKTLGDAQDGSKGAISAFEKIGISQADIASGTVDSEAALAAFVKKMEETKDPAEAAAMAAALFGKSGASIGAALSGVPGQVGALVDRARELGVVMGPEAVKAAGDFDQKMNELGTQFETTKLKLANVLLPVLVNEFIPLLQETIIPAIDGVIVKLGEWFTAFGGLDPAVQTAVGVFATAFAVGGPVLLAIGAVSAAIGAIFIGPAAPLIGFVAAVGAASAIWPGFGTAAKDAFVFVGGSVVALIDLLGKLIVTIGAVEQAFVDLFKVSKSDIAGMSFSNPNGGGDGTSGLGLLGSGGGGMGDFPGGGSGTSNSSSTGASVADGLVNGMTSRLTERLPEVQAAVQAVTDVARATLGVQSPSTVFAEIGQFVGEGLANGIASTQSMVAGAVSAMGAGAVGASNAMVSDILSGLDTLFAGSQKVGAGIALINSLIGASLELKKGTFGFASAARVIAQGAAFVKAIKGAGSGGRGGAVAGGGGGGAAAPQQPVQNLGLTFISDPFGIGENTARAIARQVNEAQRNGMRLNVSVMA